MVFILMVILLSFITHRVIRRRREKKANNLMYGAVQVHGGIPIKGSPQHLYMRGRL